MSFRRLLLFLNFLLVYVPQLLSTLENAYGVIVSLCTIYVSMDLTLNTSAFAANSQPHIPHILVGRTKASQECGKIF